MKNRYIKVPSIVEKNKLHFSLKYFNFSNSSSLKFKNYKKFFNKLQQCHNQNIDELISNNQIIMIKQSLQKWNKQQRN